MLLGPLALSTCGGSQAGASRSESSMHADAAGTVWLCRPGVLPDPCLRNLDVTSVPTSGPRSTQEVAPAANPKLDCFYVYPTVSTQSTRNSNLAIESAETDVAVDQASPCSQVCRVWTPMYKQRTVTSLLKGLGGDPAAD